jgi:hypothetical protein
MSPPDAPRPPVAAGGRAESGGAELDDDSIALQYVLEGDQLQPATIAVHQVVPNEKAHKDNSPPPDWVVETLVKVHRCDPYPRSARHHVNVWEHLVRRLPVSSQAKGVASVLGEHWPDITPSLARIAFLTGMSRSSCDNGIYMLRAAGLLEVESRPGRRTRYVPFYPSRPISRQEVAMIEKWRRNRRPQPAQPAGTSTGGTRPTRRQVPAQPAATGAQRAATGCPTGTHEVCNEALKEDLNQDLAGAPLSFLDAVAEAHALGESTPSFDSYIARGA